MIEVIHGKLTRWDTGRAVKVIPDDGATVDEIHIDDGVTSYKVPLTLGEDHVTAPIPNIILQKSGKITIHSVAVTADGKRVEETLTRVVYGRVKPTDYIYTETEIYDFESIVKKALLEAKESGEFNGEKGDPGEDYVLTDEDKAEIVNQVLSLIPNGDEVYY